MTISGETHRKLSRLKDFKVLNNLDKAIIYLLNSNESLYKVCQGRCKRKAFLPEGDHCNTCGGSLK